MRKLYVGRIEQLSDPQKYEEALYMVNEQRRAKVLRCKNENDRCRSLMAGILLKQGLEELGLEYDKVTFATTAYGKPYLADYPDIHYSISHAGDYAVCFLADVPVGVDIEVTTRRLFAEDKQTQRDNLAKRCLSEAEFQCYLQYDNRAQIEYLVKLWTRKESISKINGEGLQMDFRLVEEDETHIRGYWLSPECYLSMCCRDFHPEEEEVEICMMN